MARRRAMTPRLVGRLIPPPVLFLAPGNRTARALLGTTLSAGRACANPGASPMTPALLMPSACPPGHAKTQCARTLPLLPALTRRAPTRRSAAQPANVALPAWVSRALPRRSVTLPCNACRASAVCPRNSTESLCAAALFLWFAIGRRISWPSFVCTLNDLIVT